MGCIAVWFSTCYYVHFFFFMLCFSDPPLVVEMPQETAKVVPKKVYVCDQCDERFEDDFTKLLRHRLVHGEDGVELPRFWCLRCGHGSNTADELELHLTLHRGRPIAKKHKQGTAYGRDFLYIADLRNCLSACGNSKIFACDKCDRSYRSLNSLQLHLYRHGEKRLMCDRCSKVFHFARELNAHKLWHSGQNRCICSVCGKSFAGKGVLKTHMYIHTREWPYKCNVCPRGFRTAGNLERHSLVHLKHTETQTDIETMKLKHGGKPVQCNICKKMLSCRSSLRCHLRLHQGVKPHACKLCEKKFTLPSALRIHMRDRHSDERPFPCCVCDKSFKSKFSLKLHLVLHSQPGVKHVCKFPDDRCAFAEHVRAKTLKVHVCPVCGKACAVKAKLKLHMQVHNGEAAVCPCSVCGQMYRSVHTLKVHMRLHTGEKPYGCKVCGKRFVQAGNLSIHLRMHSGAKPYQCKICSRAFSVRYWLKIHVRTHKSSELIDAPEYRIQKRNFHNISNSKITNSGSKQKRKSNRKTKKRDLAKANLSQAKASLFQAEASLSQPTTYLSQTANEEAHYPCGLDVPDESVGEYLEASNNVSSEFFSYGNESLFADCEQPGEPIHEETVG